MKVGSNSHKFLIIIFPVVLLFSFGFYLDIKPKIILLTQKYAEENALLVQIKNANELLSNENLIQNKWNEIMQKMSRYLRVDNKSLEAGELLSAIQRAGEINGLLLNSIQPGDWQNVSGMNVLSIHLGATGNFFQFFEFIAMLNRYSLPIELLDFSLHADQYGMLQIDLQLLGFYIPSVQNNLSSKGSWFPIKTPQTMLNRDPFVLDSDFELSNKDNDAHELLNSVSLEQIKLVGYLHQANQFWALVMLPSGKAVEISLGSILGLEKARVISMNEQEVVLALGSKKLRLEYIH